MISKTKCRELNQIAAGLSGSLAGDSSGSFVAGAEIGKGDKANHNLTTGTLTTENIENHLCSEVGEVFHKVCCL